MQDGRQGEAPADWLYSQWPSGTGSIEDLPIQWFYMGGAIYDEGVPIDSSEDTDYMLTVYYDSSYSTAQYPFGNWTAFMVITNRVFADLPNWILSGNLVPYCSWPLAGAPGPACPPE